MYKSNIEILEWFWVTMPHSLKLTPVLTVLDMSDPSCASDWLRPSSDKHTLSRPTTPSVSTFTVIIFYWFSVGLSWPDHCNQPNSNKSSPSLKPILEVKVEARLWFGLCTSVDWNSLSCNINTVYRGWGIFKLNSMCHYWDIEEIFGNTGSTDNNL